MVEAANSTRNPKNRSRSPLFPSEKNNTANYRKPRVKEMSPSNYSSTSPSCINSKRSQSVDPLSSEKNNAANCWKPRVKEMSSSNLSATSPSSINSKRSQSVDRPRRLNNGISSEVSVSKSACTTRRVSVSFQGESFVFQTSKIQNGSPDRRINMARKIILSGRSGDFGVSTDKNSFESSRNFPSSVNSSVKSHPSLSKVMGSPSIINFAAEILKKGKRGENRIEEAHSLRLLHNHHLQWRFMNARASSLLFQQNLAAERSLHNAWMATTQKLDSVVMKRITLHLLRRNMKFGFLLKEQMVYLEEWSLIHLEHEISLSGAVEALKAAILRLPVVGGARGSVQDIKNAVGAAVDVMKSMESSLRSMLSKVDKTSYMAMELLKVAAQERALLEESQSLLCRIAEMHVEQCSLRAHLQQLSCHHG